MHSIVTTFRGADIKVEVANFCAAMDTLIGQDGIHYTHDYFINGSNMRTSNSGFLGGTLFLTLADT